MKASQSATKLCSADRFSTRSLSSFWPYDPGAVEWGLDCFGFDEFVPGFQAGLPNNFECRKFHVAVAKHGDCGLASCGVGRQIQKFRQEFLCRCQSGPQCNSLSVNQPRSMGSS